MNLQIYSPKAPKVRFSDFVKSDMPVCIANETSTQYAGEPFCRDGKAMSAHGFTNYVLPNGLLSLVARHEYQRTIVTNKSNRSK